MRAVATERSVAIGLRMSGAFNFCVYMFLYVFFWFWNRKGLNEIYTFSIFLGCVVLTNQSAIVFWSSPLLTRISFTHPMTTMTPPIKSEEGRYEEYHGISPSKHEVEIMAPLFNLQRHFGEAFRLHFPACPHVLRSLAGRHSARDGVCADLLPTERLSRGPALAPGAGELPRPSSGRSRCLWRYRWPWPSWSTGQEAFGKSGEKGNYPYYIYIYAPTPSPQL